MFKKTLNFLFTRKYGLPVTILILVIVVFMFGIWLGSNSEKSLINPSVPVSAEEKSWREAGLLFGDGIYVVGSDIEAGIYRTKGEDTSLYGCRWQRLSGFGAENDNLIARYQEDKGMATIVTIAPGDKGFKTEGCGTWYAASLPVVEMSGSFGDGAFIVGDDIAPGIYRSPASYGCYWERLSGFTRETYSARLFGQDEELIANSNNAVVEISPSDKGFVSYNCKDWVKQ